MFGSGVVHPSDGSYSVHISLRTDLTPLTTEAPDFWTFSCVSNRRDAKNSADSSSSNSGSSTSAASAQQQPQQDGLQRMSEGVSSSSTSAGSAQQRQQQGGSSGGSSKSKGSGRKLAAPAILLSPDEVYHDERDVRLYVPVTGLAADVAMSSGMNCTLLAAGHETPVQVELRPQSRGIGLAAIGTHVDTMHSQPHLMSIVTGHKSSRHLLGVADSASPAAAAAEDALLSDSPTLSLSIISPVPLPYGVCGTASIPLAALLAQYRPQILVGPMCNLFYGSEWLLISVVFATSSAAVAFGNFAAPAAALQPLTRSLLIDGLNLTCGSTLSVVIQGQQPLRIVPDPSTSALWPELVCEGGYLSRPPSHTPLLPPVPPPSLTTVVHPPTSTLTAPATPDVVWRYPSYPPSPRPPPGSPSTAYPPRSPYPPTYPALPSYPPPSPHHNSAQPPPPKLPPIDAPAVPPYAPYPPTPQPRLPLPPRLSGLSPPPSNLQPPRDSTPPYPPHYASYPPPYPLQTPWPPSSPQASPLPPTSPQASPPPPISTVPPPPTVGLPLPLPQPPWPPQRPVAVSLSIVTGSTKWDKQAVLSAWLLLCHSSSEVSAQLYNATCTASWSGGKCVATVGTSMGASAMLAAIDAHVATFYVDAKLPCGTSLFAFTQGSMQLYVCGPDGVPGNLQLLCCKRPPPGTVPPPRRSSDVPPPSGVPPSLPNPRFAPSPPPPATPPATPPLRPNPGVPLVPSPPASPRLPLPPRALPSLLPNPPPPSPSPPPPAPYPPAPFAPPFNPSPPPPSPPPPSPPPPPLLPPPSPSPSPPSPPPSPPRPSPSPPPSPPPFIIFPPAFEVPAAPMVRRPPPSSPAPADPSVAAAFPWSPCNRQARASNYALSAPVARLSSYGLKLYCFTVLHEDGVCTNPASGCCDFMLYKVDFLVDAACIGSLAYTTINSVFKAPFLALKPGPAVRVTQLYLNSWDANGTEICLALRPPCSTLNALFPQGNMRYAMFNEPLSGSYTKCCPVGSAKMAPGL